MRKIFYTCLGVAILAHSTASLAQTLVTGTNFKPKADKQNELFSGVNDLEQFGIQPGILTTNVPLAANTTNFNSKFQYAVTGNPGSLDPAQYVDLSATPDYMMVVTPKPVGSNANILQYAVSGLVPNSVVVAKIEYISVIKSTLAVCTGQTLSFKAGINLDQFNQNNGTDAPQITMGGSSVYQVTGKADANGEAVLRVNAIMDGTCRALGFKNIEVRGTPAPKIRSSEGNERCAGEQTILSTIENYYNVGYQWQVKTNGIWTNLPGGTKKQILVELPLEKAYIFRFLITPAAAQALVSDTFVVNSIKCCDLNGKRASVQPIWWDNLGRVDLSDNTGSKYFSWDFTDPLHPKEVVKTSTSPFRWQLATPPLGATFVATGPVVDNQYTVAGYLTNYNAYNGINGAKLEWASNVGGYTSIPPISYDHSQQLDGAALFINLTGTSSKKVILTKTITNLKPGVNTFFETWITVFTSEALGVDINLRVTDVDNPSNVITINRKANAAAVGDGKWARIAGQIIPTGTSLLMEVIDNNSNTMMPPFGNDLVIDDFKVSVCAPPSANLFFDTASLATVRDICSLPITLESKPSALLRDFHDGAAQFLFQWTKTPLVSTSWKNLNTPSSTPKCEFSVSSLGTLTKGEKVYFRTLVAKSTVWSEYSLFQGTVAASPYDASRKYSVSNTVVATVANDCSVTDLEEAKGATQQLLLYPNPAQHSFAFNKVVVSVNVYNTIGEPVLQTTESTINIDQWPVGIYQVVATLANGQTVCQKLVKE